jgi:hypothetical protein
MAVWRAGGRHSDGRFSPQGPNAWRIAAVADFNVDGQADVVWQNLISGDSQIRFLGGPIGVQLGHGAPERLQGNFGLKHAKKDG